MYVYEYKDVCIETSPGVSCHSLPWKVVYVVYIYLFIEAFCHSYEQLLIRVVVLCYTDSVSARL